ncbi:MAG: hypothetical protein HUJ31_05500, partial [Pseudomonadales bacterium]|nr:hypothetical protein [Pseudomonadales bacterium]
MSEVTADKVFTPGDFRPAGKKTDVEQISRPSLSYWQDAWIRLKRNKRALISLYIVIGLAFFTLLGPFLWPVDPSRQDLNQISQAPSLPKKARLVDAYEPWDGVILESVPPEPEQFPDSATAPENLRTFEEPTTQHVRLVWDYVDGAAGYNIYRNQREPTGFNDLGLPLGSTLGGNEVSYEDRLDLNPTTYYYSIVPTDGIEEYEVWSTLEVTPTMPVPPRAAREPDLL